MNEKTVPLKAPGKTLGDQQSHKNLPNCWGRKNILPKIKSKCKFLFSFSSFFIIFILFVLALMDIFRVKEYYYFFKYLTRTKFLKKRRFMQLCIKHVTITPTLIELIWIGRWLWDRWLIALLVSRYTGKLIRLRISMNFCPNKYLRAEKCYNW